MPTPDIFSLNDFKLSPVGRFAPGAWVVEYHDRTHLPRDIYISLGEVEIEKCPQKGEAFFRFRPRSRESLDGTRTAKQFPETSSDLVSFHEVWDEGKGDGRQAANCAAKAAEYVLDQLGESMMRLGLVRPTFEIDHPEFIIERRFAIVVLDTNALRNGAVRHLRERFQSVQLWAIIPLVSLMEIGERVAYITSKAGGDYNPKNYALIRLRPQVTVAPQEVKWIKENFPTETLELGPELLRTFRGYDTQKSPDREPDRVSINDRLILEGIKDLRRQRGLPEGVYLMSSDKDMSRLARLEGIHTIYPARPAIRESPDGIYSIRYSLEARTYIFCSIHRFLWDLTHVFSKIRARCISGAQKGHALELFYYFPTKLVNDWVDDKLEVTYLGSGSAANIV